MAPDAWVMMGILILMFALLIWNKFPSWLVFMGTLTVAMTLRLAEAQSLLKGFANSGVITVGVLFPVAAGMYATGAVTLLADKLIGLPKSLGKAQIKILPPVGIGSAFLNNTPLAAMMIPVIRDICRTTGLAASKLFMPLSFVSLLGGAATVIGTSTNLIIAGLVADHIAKGDLPGMKPINLFDPAWIGLPAAAVGILFIIQASNRLLPARKGETQAEGIRRMYRAEFVVDPDSRLDGKTVEAAGFSGPIGFVLNSITRVDGTHIDVHPAQILRGGDLLVFFAQSDILPVLWTTIGLQPRHRSQRSPERHQHRLVEAVVSPSTPALGRSISELPLPERPYQIGLIGLSRSGQAPGTPLADLTVQGGDAVILEVDDSFFYENRREEDFILTKRLRGYRIQRTDRAIIATVITGGMILLVVTGVMSMLNAALLATLAMLATGCLTARRIWQSLEWDTLVVLGAAVGLESAVTKTGLSRAIAGFLEAMGGGSPLTALAMMFVGSVVMTNIITKAAAAAFMFPVAMSLAHDLGVSFMPFVMILMLGTSYAFINPASSHTNLMVQEPGGYGFLDFVKMGFPLTILAGITAVALAPLVYGF
jgi:di/tricarboxylate transporter